MSLSKFYPTSDTDDVDPASVWTSLKSIEIPTTDILTYTFDNLGQYDQDSPIFIDANNPSNKISAKQAVETVVRLAKGLKALGLKDGECVCLHAFNSIWYPLIWLGIIGSGARVAGSNPKYTKSELVHLLDLTKPKFVVAQSDCIDSMVEATAAARSRIDPSHIFTIDTSIDTAEFFELDVRDAAKTHTVVEGPEDPQASAEASISAAIGDSTAIDCSSVDASTKATAATPLDDVDHLKAVNMTNHGTPHVRGHSSWRTLLLEVDSDRTIVEEDTKLDQARIAVYAMTSGTTGLPKAAAIAHRSIVAQTALLEDQFSTRPYQPSQLICLPVFHAFASPLALVLPLRLGIPTFFLPRWSLPEYLRAVQAFGITDSPLCPPIAGSLTQLPVAQYAALQSLRCVVFAGAALPASVQNKLYDILAPQAVVTQSWGTTEAGWHSHGELKEQDRSGSIGRLLPNIQMKLVAEDGKITTEEGKPGEAFIKTPMLFSDYVDNPEASAQAFDSDGFYRTGDEVYVRDGNLYYNDRIKDTMKVKGWQVSPTELESVLIQHPEIADAAVVGTTKHNQLGIPETFPTAYVVRLSGGEASPLSEQDVKDFVAKRVISYKRITGDVVFVTHIPRSAAGKILRRNLAQTERDLSKEGLLANAESAALVGETENKGWTQFLWNFWHNLEWRQSKE